MTELGKALLHSMRESPPRWVQGEYTIKHTPTGIEIWTASIPILDIEAFRPKAYLSLHDRWNIYWEIKRVNSTNLINKLQDFKTQ